MHPTFVRSLAAAAMLAFTLSAEAQAPAGGETLVIELKTGKVVIQLKPELAPKHVARVKQLAAEGFYNGQIFHRVLEGFMAQTGDPQGTGGGGSTYPDLQAEFTRYAFRRGTIGAARTQDPNTANSQFFICFDDRGCLSLTGSYTVWGQVVSGMELVDKIAKGEPPTNPDKMLKVYLGK